MRFRPQALAWVVLFGLGFAPAGAGAQLRVDLLYGLDRNVADGAADHDGWMNATVEWVRASGVGLGIGTDHHFEEASPSAIGHLGWAIFMSSSYTPTFGRWRPFLRGGIGAGRAPCSGDTCGSGLYLRASAGVRAHLSERFGVVGEAGVSRVSRPFAGLGLSIRP
jgi:hypothetical protein